MSNNKKMAMPSSAEFVEKLVAFMEEDKRPSPAEIEKYVKLMDDRHISKHDNHVDGEYTFLPPFHPDTIKAGYNNWQPNKGDVLVTTYAKTGTTWAREIVRQLLYKNDEKLDKFSQIIHSADPYIETGPPEKFDFLKNLPLKRRVIGTHVPEELVNVKKLKESGVKMIYVYRNPKDTVVSFHKFLNAIPFSEKTKATIPKDFEEFTEKFMQGKLPDGMKDGEWYPHHIKQWMKHKDDESFLFLCYEDMKTDPIKEIGEIATFIDCGATQKDVEDVAKATDFDAMKKEQMKKSNQITSLLMNKGKVGNWRSKFSEELSKKMDEKIKKDLDGVDIEFVYDF